MLAVLALVVLLTKPSVTFFLVGVAYVASGPIEAYWRWRTGRPLVPARRDPPRPTREAPPMSDDKRIRIFDTTLRDGEQSPGCSMNLSEKLVLARQLAKLGVDVIEAGFAIASEGDFEAVKAIAAELGGVSIASLARTSREDIERAARALERAKRPRIHTFIATSDIHLQHKLKMGREQVLEEVDRAVRQARGYVGDVEFSAEDATRSSWDYLVQVFGAAVKAGATTLNVPDTVGYTTPVEYHELIRYLRAHVPGADGVIFSLHCHNDLGLAVANSLAAIQAGARQVECTVNGIGERAGNTAMEEVVMALKTRPDVFGGLDTGIRTTEIYPTSRLLSSIIGIPVQPNKAIVGDNAFAHEAGIHQHGVLQAAITYEIMTPQSIGRPSNELVLGKHSGRHAFKDRLQRARLRARRRGLPARLQALQGPRGQEEEHLQRGPRVDRGGLGDRRGGPLPARQPGGAERHLRDAERDGRAAGGRRVEEGHRAGRRPGGRGVPRDQRAQRHEVRAGAVPGEGHHRRHGRAGRGDRHDLRGRPARDRPRRAHRHPRGLRARLRERDQQARVAAEAARPGRAAEGSERAWKRY